MFPYGIPLRRPEKDGSGDLSAAAWGPTSSPHADPGASGIFFRLPLARPAPRDEATSWTLDLRQVAAAHQIERARMSSPLAAVRLSIASDGNSSTVEPSVDTSNPLRRHLSWMVFA